MILFILLRLSLLFTRSEENLNIHHNERAFQLSLIKAMTIAHVAKFFQLPILIWNKNTNELATNLNHTLVIGYIILALTHVYSGTGEFLGPRFHSISILIIAICSDVQSRQMLLGPHHRLRIIVNIDILINDKHANNLHKLYLIESE